ncbi:hypothetical protein JY651_48495 [Pyxidicoccus parkwayensis]|uniref:PRC-barrel domain-containing protein n=1 Tax=Pyxidicoccus parkwayensis TaxID=2813578 RepID=A0ABX7NZH4_9BACT|nr:hypothetical protein [Pyxidicoccus parkwaysis]QSQ22855.1 hypothetical protein JY651_48495 [Pyxidicoccus parkwaysis]
MFNPANIHMGMTARDRDGEVVGTVISVDAGGFFIGRGDYFSKDHRVAFSDVMDLDGDDVYLREAVSDLPGVDPEALNRSASGRSSEGRTLAHDLTGGLGLAPRDLEQARMDSAKFQDHGRYDIGPGASAHGEREHRRDDLISEVDPAVVAVRQPPVVVERRAACDEEETSRREAPSDVNPRTRR